MSSTSEHPSICFLTDAQLMLLATLVAAEQANSDCLTRLVFGIVKPILQGAGVHYYRSDIIGDPAYVGVVGEVTYHEDTVCAITVHPRCRDLQAVPLADIVGMWAQMHIQRPPSLDACTAASMSAVDALAPNVFRDTLVRVAQAHGGGVDHDMVCLRDLLPPLVRQGRAQCIFMWLCHLVPLPHLRLDTSDKIQRFVRHFVAEQQQQQQQQRQPMIPVHVVSEVRIREVTATLMARCTVWHKVSENTCIYLFCCCNRIDKASPTSKRSYHKMWHTDVIQLLFWSQVSHRQQDMSLSVRPPNVGVPASNWDNVMTKCHTTMDAKHSHKRQRNGYEPDQCSGSSRDEEYLEVEGLEHVLREIKVSSAELVEEEQKCRNAMMQTLQCYTGHPLHQVSSLIGETYLSYISLSMVDQTRIANAITSSVEPWVTIYCEPPQLLSSA